MSIGKISLKMVLLISCMVIGLVVKPIGFSPLPIIPIQTPKDQVYYYDWLGDYPIFSFNYENNSYIDTPVFNITWNYFTNDTIGKGFVLDFEVYVNNETSKVMETLAVSTPYLHKEIQIYGETFLFKDWSERFTIEDYPRTLEINLTRMGIAFGTVFRIYFLFAINTTVSITSYLILHYADQTIIPIETIPPISYTYMIIGIVALGGFIAIYYFYQSRLKKKEEKVKYVYEE